MSFVTGSHAYGTPTENSDVDIVLVLGESDTERLKKIDPQYCEKPGSGISFKIGKVNLIVFPASEEGSKHYGDRFGVTYDLIMRAPVTREEAVEHFKKNGVGWDRCSSGKPPEKTQSLEPDEIIF